MLYKGNWKYWITETKYKIYTYKVNTHIKIQHLSRVDLASYLAPNPRFSTLVHLTSNYFNCHP